MTVVFVLMVKPEFWDEPRQWPRGCRPVVYSVELVMQNHGALHVPASFAAEVEQQLRQHPHVLSAVREPLPFPSGTARVPRAA